MARSTPGRRRWVRRGLGAAAGFAAVFLLAAYLVLPPLWSEHEKRHHPALDAAPRVTTHADGIPGDPINVGLVGIPGDPINVGLVGIPS